MRVAEKGYTYFKNLQQMLQDLLAISDHFVTLCIQGLTKFRSFSDTSNHLPLRNKLENRNLFERICRLYTNFQACSCICSKNRNALNK